jgi:hypothetical protein
MITDSPDRNEAAELFLNLLIARAYDGAIRDVMSILKGGPPGRKSPQDLVRLNQWFQNLDNESRGYVFALIRESVDAAVFGCLVFLDGLAGSYPGEKPSDFALYFQVYEDKRSRKSNSPKVSVRLNPASTTDEDLHDMFRWILQERAEHEE